jgi:hypothetical protein
MSSTAILSSAIVLCLRVVGSSLQRREDDAMADSFVSRFGYYTIIWDTTPRLLPDGPGVVVPQPIASLVFGL